MQLATGAAVLSMFFAACAGRTAPEPAPSPEPGPVLGYLETRHGTITIELGPDGPLYTVVAPDGTTRARRVDAAYLEVHFPEFHALVEASVADGGGLGGLGYVE